jgi:ribosomal protein L23
MNALFNKKTKEDKKEVKVVSHSGAGSHTLLRPRITEKATFSSEKGVYIFEVSPRAGKKEIFDAIVSAYKEKPVKVNIVKVPSKVRFIRGKWGKTASKKKAYVYFAKGTKIEVL